MLDLADFEDCGLNDDDISIIKSAINGIVKKEELFTIITNLRNTNFHKQVINLCSYLLSKDIDDYLISYNLSISLFYVDKKDDAERFLFLTVYNPETNSNIYNSCCSNTRFYSKDINKDINGEKINIKFTPPLIENPKNKGDRYECCNPFLLKKLQDNGYWYLVRCVNYTQQFAKHYSFKSKDDKCRTRNYLMSLNDKFEVLNTWEIVDTVDHYVNDRAHVLGLEDCRLVNTIENDKEVLYISCNTQDCHIYRGPKITWCKLGEIEKSNNIIELKTLDVLLYPYEQQLKNNPTFLCIEKNWLPFNYNTDNADADATNVDAAKADKLHYLYKTFPFTILEFDVNNCHNITEIKKIENVHGLKDKNIRMRNSAGPVKYKKGWLSLIHEVVIDDKGRNYYHRFIYTKENGKLRVSSIFKFENSRIEFSSSMLINADNLYVTYAVEDKSHNILKISLDYLESILYKVSKVLN